MRTRRIAPLAAATAVFLIIVVFGDAQFCSWARGQCQRINFFLRTLTAGNTGFVSPWEAVTLALAQGIG